MPSARARPSRTARMSSRSWAVVEGGPVQSASWTLRAEVVFDRRRNTSATWDSYPIRFTDTPEVRVDFMRAGRGEVGACEASLVPERSNDFARAALI
jgi:hypothetical protein